MKRISPLVFLVLVLVLSLAAGPAMLFADLEDFKRGVEDEEERNRGKEEEREEEEENGEGEENPFLAFLYRISLYLWLIHNGSVYYDIYPYGPAREGFLQHDLDRSRAYGDESGSGGELPPEKTHWFELAVAGGGFYEEGADRFPPQGIGGFASLQGRFYPFLGPDIDYRYYRDRSGELHTVGAGLDLPLVQTDPFCWSAYGKWVMWRGMIDREGGAAGFTFRSYLFRPVSLYLRAGGVFFPNLTIGQVEGRLNIHLGAFTVFAGVNLLETEIDKNRLLSLEAGSSVYF